MKFRKDIINLSVSYYHKLIEKDPAILPEDGFVAALENLDTGYDLTKDEYSQYVTEVTRLVTPGNCITDGEYEQLPENIYTASGESFNACEGQWHLLSEFDMKRFLESARGVCKSMGYDYADFEWDRASALLSSGLVLHLPLGYVRKRTSLAKCGRCGRSVEGLPALSRIDNKTALCNDCGQQEAFEDYYNLIGE